MDYTIETIVRDARIAMGLNPEAEPAWHADAICRQLTPDDSIALYAEEAAREVCANDDEADLTECVKPITAAPVFATDHSGSIPLPEDFMRLCALWMDDWERPACRPLPVDSVEYRMQHSRYPGLRSNPQRPACAVACKEGTSVLEFFGCKSRNAMVKQGLYHPFPTLSDGILANLPSRLYPKMIERLCSRLR